ncbi:hypothetical protein [Bythopirellula polymerisocia]|uniref:Uncharacterized protein n=1 Tax=Bythopirellula polymerisocia TaxID=2528003 RepID=A0A5C6CHV7_9BACT|nr:hypothetical protein [Bythopirellula polymerisocia]TWU23635.1 hypothetical protein Pla144_38100 [Bythopirellula polymerisocia]
MVDNNISELPEVAKQCCEYFASRDIAVFKNEGEDFHRIRMAGHVMELHFAKLDNPFPFAADGGIYGGPVWCFAIRLADGRYCTEICVGDSSVTNCFDAALKRLLEDVQHLTQPD